MLSKVLWSFKKRLPSKSMCYIWNKLSPKKEEERYKKSKYDYVELKFGNEARQIISEGIMQMSDTVAKTFGPLGKNVAISEGKAPVIVTKDGVTVAKYIKFGSRKKNIGCKLLSSIAGSTNEHAGDGTTTSTVLAAEIVKLIKTNFRKGNHLINIGFHPLQVKKGIEQASTKFVEYLDATKSFVKDQKDLMHLAMITTNKDQEISKIVSQAILEAGSKAIIQIEESQTGVNELKIEEGMFLPNGLASQEFITFSTEGNIIFDNPLILVVDSPITSLSDIVKTIEYIKSIDRPLVIFSPDIKKEPLMNIPDYLGDNANLEILNDICMMTGAKRLKGSDLAQADAESDILFEENFGACRRIKVNGLETVLMGVSGNEEDIKDILGKLEYQFKNESHPGYKNYYKDRLSRLQGKSCTIYVGGLTPVEVTETRDKVVDALNSCQTSMEKGILPGGGNAFIHALKVLDGMKLQDRDLNVGVNIFNQANTLKHLFKNAPLFADMIIETVKNSDNPLYGYDIATGKYSDNMIEEGIVDSFNTLKTAIEDAVSVASLLITTECIVVREHDYDPPPLAAFKNRIKTDPEYRNKVKREFHESGDNDEDLKIFSSVI